MIENEYLLAWAIYAVAALGCLLVWFRMTGWMWRWVREPLRVVMGVLLLTPTLVDQARDLYAPALAITALDLLFHAGSSAWRSVSDLVLYSLSALCFYLVLAVLRWLVQRWLQDGREEQAPAADEEPTLRELMARQPAGTGDRQGPRLRIEPRI